MRPTMKLYAGSKRSVCRAGGERSARAPVHEVAVHRAKPADPAGDRKSRTIAGLTLSPEGSPRNEEGRAPRSPLRSAERDRERPPILRDFRPCSASQAAA